MNYKTVDNNTIIELDIYNLKKKNINHRPIDANIQI